MDARREIPNVTALQPYWVTRACRGALSVEDQRALGANVTPPGAIAYARGASNRAARATGGLAALGLLLATAGALHLAMGGDLDGGLGPVLILFGGVMFLSCLPFALSSLVIRARFVPVPLTRITESVVEVRRTGRVTSSYQRPMPVPLELVLASGLVIELPIMCDDVGGAVVPGHAYRIWYLPEKGIVPNLLVYMDHG